MRSGTREQPHYLDLTLLGQAEPPASVSAGSSHRRGWLLAGLLLAALFLIGAGVTGWAG